MAENNGGRRFNEQDAELAVNSIAEVIGNIEAAIFVLDEGLKSTQGGSLHPQMFQQIFRMTLSWLVLSTAKTAELWRVYGSLGSTETITRMRAVLKEVAKRGIIELRNKAIAHLLDKETGKPMTPERLQEAMVAMVGEDWLAFFHWYRHPEIEFADTVSGALRLFRLDVLKKFPRTRITMPVSGYTASG